MNLAARHQAKLYQAYAVVAQNLGRSYTVYRGGLDSPISPANRLCFVNAAFSSSSGDMNFIVPHGLKLPTWNAWVDATTLQKGDWLVGDYGTFYLADLPPSLPIQAVWCNTTVSIVRPGYAAGTQTTTTVATAIPAFLHVDRVDIKPIPGNPSPTSGQAISRWTGYLNLPRGTLKQHDLFTDEEGATYELDAAEWTTLGYLCKLRLNQP